MLWTIFTNEKHHFLKENQFFNKSIYIIFYIDGPFESSGELASPHARRTIISDG